ncbi:hypothetical protein GOP47_0010359 [Adiantum capillus-veneris]|uniref:Uncharacterized protein n=1 Tax=Adiantum capillus-veneris TaxID=13818 RepID=A0A9D4UUK4_ADICA|nr:hypothetical protein GOP47_0010359 [Adiantum capillus-veneris]
MRKSTHMWSSGHHTEQRDLTQKRKAIKVDNAHGPEEACQEIVPYVVQTKVASGMDARDENHIHMHRA